MTPRLLRPRNPWRGLRGLPPHVWVVSAATLVNRVGTMVLPFLALYVTQHLGMPPSRAGLVLSAFGVGGLVAAPLGGWLSDRFGAVRVMAAGFVGSGLLLALFPLVARYEVLVGLTTLWAVFSETARPATLVALTDGLRPDQRKAAIALNRLAVNLGMGIGPAVGGLLVSTSFALLFWIDAVTAVAAGGLLALAAGRLGIRPPDGRGPRPHGARDLLGALRDPRMGGLLVGTLLAFLVFEQHRSTLPLFLTDGLGLSATFYGTLFLVNVGLILLLEVPLNLATAHWPHGRTLALGAALVAVGFGATGLAGGAAGVVATVVVWTFGEMLLFPGMAAYVADVAPEARRGAYMGAYSLTIWVAVIPASFLGTLLLERAGGGALWAASLVVGCAAAAAFALLVRRPTGRG
ncbi:MAG: MFS transporter [Rubricoccaceae bacterium]|nr:MFS transporter [Rubricoccaceae bacterium]